MPLIVYRAVDLTGLNWVAREWVGYIDRGLQTADQFTGLLKRLRERRATNAQPEFLQPGCNQQRILQVIEKRAK